MKWFRRSSILAIAVVAIVFVSCGDDDSAGPGDGGTPNTEGPGIDSVVAVDGNHIDVYFDEAVSKSTAEQDRYYTVVKRSPGASTPRSPAPGDTLLINSVVLKADYQTATVELIDPMSNVAYEMLVCCIEDLSGNRMSSTLSAYFTGTTAADNTPPEIAARTPGPGATGVGTAQPVVVQFSEMVIMYSVLDGFSWTGGGGVLFEMETFDEINFVITPKLPLSTNTTYTVEFSGVVDYSLNAMPTVSWSFTTAPTPDTTPPTLVSSTPSNGQRNVSVDTDFVLTFSEAIDQTNFDAIVTPNPGDGILVWSNGNRTATFDPFVPLQDDTQYLLVIVPGGVRDLAGNGIEDPVSILFTTGAGLESGSFAGTVSGDPGTPAANPAGTVVVAPTVPIFGSEGDFGIFGSGVVGSGGHYTVSSLPDGVYYPVGVLDSNGDGKLDPDYGDAIGGYGMDVRQMDMTPDSITVVGGGSVSNVDFPLYDQSAVSGTYSYSGTATGDYQVYIAAFDVNGFNINDLGDPVFSTDEWWPYHVEWWMSEMGTGGFVPGNYYIGAYMDLNGDQMYDPLNEPANFYGGVPTPTAVDLTSGRDALGIHITLVDPIPVGSSPAAIPWGPSVKKNVEWFKRLSAIVNQAIH